MPPPSRMQPHVDLEAIVALHCILGDVRAGAQVNLAIQLICLQQEGHDGPRTLVTLPKPPNPPPRSPAPDGGTEASHLAVSPPQQWSPCNI